MDMNAAFPMRMVEKAAGFDAAFDEFMRHSQKVLTDYMAKNFPTLPFSELKAQEGGRYVRIVKEEGSSSRSAWGFVDKTNGDVLKAAGWAAPAKNARANVFDKGSWRNVGAYGPAYMRNMMGGVMDENFIAGELVAVARSLSAMDPETREELKEAQDYEDLSDALDKEIKEMEAMQARLDKWVSKRRWDSDVQEPFVAVMSGLKTMADDMDELRVRAANW